MRPLNLKSPVSDKWRAVLGSTLVSLLVLLFLTFSVLREVKALARETDRRETEHQQQWEERRLARDTRENTRHEEVVKRLNALAEDFKKLRTNQLALQSVTPVEAMKDRARQK